MKKLRKRKIKIVKVKLPPTAVVRVIAPKNVIPVVAVVKEGMIEIAPIKRPTPQKPQTWREYLFGDL
jgi:hypothetical protein